MITRAGDYALRVLTALADRGQNVQVSSSDLACEADVPYRFLRKLIPPLTAAGLVLSRRGRGGGLRLARSAGEITLRQILESVDPDGIRLNLCVSGGSACSRKEGCSVHPGILSAQKALDDELNRLTLEELSRNDSDSRQANP